MTDARLYEEIGMIKDDVCETYLVCEGCPFDSEGLCLLTEVRDRFGYYSGAFDEMDFLVSERSIRQKWIN